MTYSHEMNIPNMRIQIHFLNMCIQILFNMKTNIFNMQIISSTLKVKSSYSYRLIKKKLREH